MDDGAGDLSIRFMIAASFWTYLRDLLAISLHLSSRVKIFLKNIYLDLSALLLVDLFNNIFRCYDKSKNTSDDKSK